MGALALSTFQGASTDAQQVGDMSVPIFTNVEIVAGVKYDATSGNYIYTYAITNPATNTGTIQFIHLDVSVPRRNVNFDHASTLTIPIGQALLTFENFQKQLNPLLTENNIFVNAFGQQVPRGWSGGLTAAGTALFASLSSASNIVPGQTLGGFVLISPSMPVMRTVTFVPHWVLRVPDESSDDDLSQAYQVEQQIQYSTLTIGPSDITQVNNADPEPWTNLQKDIPHCIKLGWLDVSFGQSILSQITSAFTSWQSKPANAKLALSNIATEIGNASSSQINNECSELLTITVNNINNAISP